MGQGRMMRCTGDEVLQEYKSETGTARHCDEDLEDVALWIPVTDTMGRHMSKMMYIEG